MDDQKDIDADSQTINYLKCSPSEDEQESSFDDGKSQTSDDHLNATFNSYGTLLQTNYTKEDIPMRFRIHLDCKILCH